MPNHARENRIRDAILTELNKIGVQGGAGAWLTTPNVTLGTPVGKDIPRTPAAQLFFHWAETLPRQGAGGREPSSHWKRAIYHVWCVTADPAQAIDLGLDLKADVLRALYAAEATLKSFADSGVFPGGEMLHPELLKSGVTVVGLEVNADFRQDHADP